MTAALVRSASERPSTISPSRLTFTAKPPVRRRARCAPNVSGSASATRSPTWARSLLRANVMTAPGAACETSAPARSSAMSVRCKKAGRGRRASRRSWPAATRADAGRRTRSQKAMTKATESESLVRLAMRAAWRASAPLTAELESHCRASSMARPVRLSPASPQLPSTVSAMASSCGWAVAYPWSAHCTFSAWLVWEGRPLQCHTVPLTDLERISWPTRNANQCVQRITPDARFDTADQGSGRARGPALRAAFPARLTARDVPAPQSEPGRAATARRDGGR